MLGSGLSPTPMAAFPTAPPSPPTLPKTMNAPIYQVNLNTAGRKLGFPLKTGRCHAIWRLRILHFLLPSRSSHDKIDRPNTDHHSISMKAPCLTALSLSLSLPAVAEDAAAEMAKKLQNPLASMKAIMTDNTIGFNTGTTNDTSYNFQIQPVYAIDFEDKGFTFIPRGVIPIMGVEPGTDFLWLDNNSPTLPARSGSTWGIGDSIFQAFFAPHTESAIKFGFGPQFSFPTATDTRLEGPGWGAGVAGVVTGSITENISFAGIVGNHWGENNNFNVMSIQPMIFYNIAAVPGMSIAYNATIAADWSAKSSDRWTVPIGFSIGRTFDMGKGHGLDISGGPYYNIARPKGAADWNFRFGLTWLFP